jgi:tryptophan-rich sensory protein
MVATLTSLTLWAEVVVAQAVMVKTEQVAGLLLRVAYLYRTPIAQVLTCLTVKVE